MDIENYQGLNYQPLENSLSKKRRLYAKMLEQGFEPQKTEMISGIAIPTSKTQGFSDLVKVGVGSYLGQKAEDDLLTLQSKKTQDKGRIFAKLMGLPNADNNSDGGSGGGSGGLSLDEISFMQSEMPDIGKSYLNNKLADQRLTTEQKNARDSGFNTPLEYWQGKQEYTAEINDKALTNEQKNATASGTDNNGQPLTPLAYQRMLENNKYDNRLKLQNDAQDNTYNENLYDRIYKNLDREDTQKHNRQLKDNELVKVVVKGVEYEMPRSHYDAILNGQYNQPQPQETLPPQPINPNGTLQQQRIQANEAVNPFREQPTPRGVSADVVKNNQAMMQNGGGLIGNINDANTNQNQVQEPVFSTYADEIPAIGKKIVSPIESGRKTLEINNANTRLAEKEKNLRGYSDILDNLQKANALLKEGNINVGAWDGIGQFIDKNIPWVGDGTTAANTETYEGLIGDTAAQALKLFGGSDSNMELDFSKAINAGDTNMSKEALKNLIAKVQRRYAEQVQDFDNEKQRYKQGDYLPDLNRPAKVNLKDLSNDDLLKQLYE